MLTTFRTNQDLEVGVNKVNHTFPTGATVIVPDPAGSNPSRNLPITNGDEQIPPSASLLCCAGLFSAGLGVAGSAVSAVTGSAILKAAGYDYNNIEATQAAAAGGAILFSISAAVGLCLAIAKLSGQNADNAPKQKNQLGEIAWAAGLAALSGVLGAAMIGFRDMTPGQYAAASATGSAVISTGVAAVSYMCS
jgi:hypothetical protein